MKQHLQILIRNCIRYSIMIYIILVLWEFAASCTIPLFVPPPNAVFKAIINLAKNGQLGNGLMYSFLRITIASLISLEISIPLGLIIYAVKPIRETLMPIVSILRFVPVTAFQPLLILWFGIDEIAKISFLFIATFVYLLPSILLCFNEVPEDLLDTGKTIGMSTWEVITEILLPASLPSICSTSLMMYGIGWTYVAVVEASNAKFGLGFIINNSSAKGKTAIVFGAIIVIMLFSFVFDKIGDWVIRQAFPWRYCDDSTE